MSQQPSEQAQQESHHCPCCNQTYTVTIKRVWEQGALYPPRKFAIGDALCEDCNKPCCPRCQCVGGQRVICTRCTTYPDCEHNEPVPSRQK